MRSTQRATRLIQFFVDANVIPVQECEKFHLNFTFGMTTVNNWKLVVWTVWNFKNSVELLTLEMRSKV